MVTPVLKKGLNDVEEPELEEHEKLQSVERHLELAEIEIRNAIVAAVEEEEPFIIRSLADVLCSIEGAKRITSKVQRFAPGYAPGQRVPASGTGSVGSVTSGGYRP